MPPPTTAAATPTTASTPTTLSVAPASAPPPSSATSHPQPRTYLRPAHVFPAQTLLARTLTPPPLPQPQVIPYSSHRFPSRQPSAARPPTAADQAVATGYIRNPSTAALMAFTARGRPYVYSGDHTPHMQVQVHHMRPPLVQQPVAPPPQFVVPRQVPPPVPGPPAAAVAPSAPLKTTPVAPQPKVNSLPSISSTPDLKNGKEREKSRDDNVMTVSGRKVRLVDGGSNSLYSLCRSWVRNGVPHETQPIFGDGVRLLPRPFPASMVDSEVLEKSEKDKDTETEDPVKEEPVLEELSVSDLLQEHIRRAKKVRARLRKERLIRIQRYKQRLSLLLPPPSELGRSDAAAGI